MVVCRVELDVSRIGLFFCRDVLEAGQVGRSLMTCLFESSSMEPCGLLLTFAFVELGGDRVGRNVDFVVEACFLLAKQDAI